MKKKAITKNKENDPYINVQEKPELSKLEGYTENNEEPVTIFLEEYCPYCTRKEYFQDEHFITITEKDCYHCNNKRRTISKSGKSLIAFLRDNE